MNAVVGVAAPSPSPSPSDGPSHAENVFWGGVLVALFWILFAIGVLWLRKRPGSGGGGDHHSWT